MQLTPQFSVSADGVDVTGRFAGRNVELEVIDATGVESDSAEFVISDPLAEVAPPRRGAGTPGRGAATVVHRVFTQ